MEQKAFIVTSAVVFLPLFNAAKSIHNFLSNKQNNAKAIIFNQIYEPKISKAWDIFYLTPTPYYPPKAILCPISGKVFKDAVVTKYGYVYERKEITAWINEKHKDPMAKKPLEIMDLKECMDMNQAVAKYERLRNKRLKAELEETIRQIENKNIPSIKPPSKLCCPLTKKLIKEAVITPYGNIYEKAAILSHLKKEECDPANNLPLLPYYLHEFPTLSAIANNYDKLREELFLEAFREKYQETFYSKLFFLRNPFSKMKKLLKNPAITISEIINYADENPNSRTAGILKKYF